MITQIERTLQLNQGFYLYRCFLSDRRSFVLLRNKKYLIQKYSEDQNILSY